MEEGEKIVISEKDFRNRFIYDQDSLLGEGGFAKVYKAYDRQFDETVALKFYAKTELQKYDIISEMRNSRRFTHKNIIRVHDARVVRFTNSFGIAEDVQVGILEYANSGNLEDFLKTTPSEDDFKRVVLGILHGLNYLHTEKRVIHRDLSPDNILMVKDHNIWIPKIADFGISKQIDLKTMNMGGNKVSSELVGKMEYMAPEQFDPKKYGVRGQIATNVDLWSFGIILTEVFTDSSPFGDRNTAQSPMQIMHNVLHNSIPSEVNKIPEPYCKVIKSCLIKDANKRVQSSQDLINIISSYTPKQQKAKAPLLIAMLVLLLVLAGAGTWYFMSQDNSGEAELVEEKTIKTEEKPQTASKPIINADTTLSATNADSSRREVSSITQAAVRENTEEGHEEFSNETPPASSVLKSSQAAAGMTSVERKEFLQSLHREIKSLDNDVIDINLRRSRIRNYISDYFTDTTASVVIQNITDSTEVEEQNIESFFNYVINTADMEVRNWEIDPLRTKLVGDKVSHLSVRKF